MLFLRTVSVALACAIVALSALPARAAISFVQALGIAQANVLITTAAGDVVVDVTIPGGGGWKTNRVRTLWSYHGGAGGRIREVTMRRNRSAPGTIRFTVSGKGANLAPPDGTPIIATIVLDAPFATTGQCGEADFGSCKKSKSGKALVCS